MNSTWSNLTAISIIGSLTSAIFVEYRSSEPQVANTERSRLTSVEPVALATAKLTGSDGSGMWNSFEEMHKVYTQAFVDSEGFGMSRILTFDEPGRKSLFVNGVPHRVAGMELIGLMQQQPVAYISNWMNITRNQLNVYEQRNLTEAELAAMTCLQQGGPHVWLPPATGSTHASDIRYDAESLHQQTVNARAIDQEHTEKHGTLIAGLTATNSCVNCHDVPEGTLLGAFIYKMERQQQPNRIVKLP